MQQSPTNLSMGMTQVGVISLVPRLPPLQGSSEGAWERDYGSITRWTNISWHQCRVTLKKYQIIQLSLDGLTLCPSFGVCFVSWTISRYILISLCRVWARKIRFTQLAPCLTSSYFTETNLSCIVSAETIHVKFLPIYNWHTTNTKTDLFLEPSPEVL